MKYQYYILTALLCMANLALADTTIINNYGSNGNNNPPAPSNPGPQGPGPSEPPYIPAGVYRNVHRDGSTDTVYTTGTKQPFYVTPPNSNNMVAPQVDVGWNPPTQQQNDAPTPRHR